MRIALVTFSDANWDNLSTVYFFEKDSRSLPSKIAVIKVDETSKL